MLIGEWVRPRISVMISTNHMIQDVWVANSEHPSNSRYSHPRYSAPFSRSVDEWWTPHPRYITKCPNHQLEDSRDKPKKSQWEGGMRYCNHRDRDADADTDTDSDAGPEPCPEYVHGRYVPRGPRSSWSRAQYTVYKEEQASWRESRLAALKGVLKRSLSREPGPGWCPGTGFRSAVVKEGPSTTLSVSGDIGGHFPRECVAGQTTRSTSAFSPGLQGDESGLTVEPNPRRAVQSDAHDMSHEPELPAKEEIGKYRTFRADTQSPII
jgi:hypothetical protein